MNDTKVAGWGIHYLNHSMNTYLKDLVIVSLVGESDEADDSLFQNVKDQAICVLIIRKEHCPIR